MTQKPALFLAVILCGVTVSSAANARIISGANFRALSSSVEVPFDEDNMQWLIRDELIHDPNAGVILKNFEAPQGTQPGSSWPVWEEFSLVSGVDLEDWHEEILTSGWSWDFVFSGLITLNGDPYPTSVLATPNRIWAEFDPISPGAGVVFDVHKRLVYDGLDFDNDGNLDPWLGGPVAVIEYPTPEPGTLALLIVSIIGVCVMMRREN